MARFVTFGGVTQFHPGALTKVNANALTPIGITATGIVHLLGEADGGVPGEVVTIDDPALAKELFRSGALADAIRVAFNPSGDARVPGGAFRVLAYKTNSGTQSSVQLPGDEAVLSGTSTGASTTTVITVTGGGLTADAHIGRWLSWNGEKRRITDNTTTTITVSPAFSGPPQNLDAIEVLESQLILTSRDYGVHTSQISVELEPGVGEGVVVTLAFEDVVERSDEIAGEAKLRIKYVGGPILDTGVATVTNATTVSFNGSGAPLSNAWAGKLIRFSDGSQREILSNTAADPSVVVLATDMDLDTDQQTDLDGTSADIVDVDSAVVSFTGASGVCTGLTSTVLDTAEDLSLTFSTLGLTSLRDLVEYLNANTNFEATVPDGVNPDTTLLVDFDFGTRNTSVDVRFDSVIDPDTSGSFRQDLVTVINWINTYSSLVTAERASVAAGEGSELPVVTGGVSGTVRDVPVYLTGGTLGTSTNSDWQDGFDALIESRGNHIVPLISDDLVNEGNGSTATFSSVMAMLKEHVARCRTTDRNEMGGYAGMDGTKTELLAQLAASNDADIQLFGQKMTFLNVDSELTEMPEWSAAVAAAGMRSGVNEVGDPLTFKVVNTSGFSQDSSWSPKNRTDVNQLLAAGLMFAENTPNGSIRWVSDNTTYTQDDNIAYTDGNTRDVVRFVVYDLRQFLEDRFTGLKASPATVASIRESAAAKLAEYNNSNILVTSLDPETQTTLIPGWRKLRVFISGDVATLRVEIFPATGVKFILAELNLQLPRLAA